MPDQPVLITNNFMIESLLFTKRTGDHLMTRENEP